MPPLLMTTKYMRSFQTIRTHEQAERIKLYKTDTPYSGKTTITQENRPLVLFITED